MVNMNIVMRDIDAWMPPMAELFLRLDDQRIYNHLARTEKRLRSRDVRDWPGTLQTARRQNLDRLHAYNTAGQYPRHRGIGQAYSAYRPCFIDAEARVCAVASLVISSGHRELAQTIAATSNEAYLHEMDSPDLLAWGQQSGLTLDELSLIQPSYPQKQIAILISFAALIITGVIGVTGVTPANQTLFVLSALCSIPFVILMFFLLRQQIIESWWIPQKLAEIEDLQGPQSVTPLVNMLSHSSFRVRTAAYKALCASPEDVTLSLSQQLTRGPDMARSLAAEVLATRSDVEALPFLHAALDKQSNVYVRKTIANAIRDLEKRLDSQSTADL
jgi:hypothetical protein